MDQHVSEQSSAKYRSVLLEMRRDARPGLDMLYLSGLAETLALIDRENVRAHGTHDLNVRAIARVSRAWGDFERDTWAGGFVLELFDGRRLYVESRADGPDWGVASVSVEAIPPDSDLPKIPLRHDSELYGWVEDLPELGDYLRRLKQGAYL